MKLSVDSVISKDKILRYLLLPRLEDDKSKYLSSVGYSFKNWETLVKDLKNAIQENEAVEIETNPYGKVFEVRAKWIGPNKKEVSVVTIWITLSSSGETRFVTLYPDR